MFGKWRRWKKPIFVAIWIHTHTEKKKRQVWKSNCQIQYKVIVVLDNTDTGILPSESDECSNFAGIKPEQNRSLSGKSFCLSLHLLRLLLCCHPLLSWQLSRAGNLEFHYQGPVLSPCSMGEPDRGCGRMGRGHLSALVVVHFVPLEEWDLCPGAVPDNRWEQAVQSLTGDTAHPLLNQKHDTAPVFATEKKADFFFRE